MKAIKQIRIFAWIQCPKCLKAVGFKNTGELYVNCPSCGTKIPRMYSVKLQRLMLPPAGQKYQ